MNNVWQYLHYGLGVNHLKIWLSPVGHCNDREYKLNKKDIIDFSCIVQLVSNEYDDDRIIAWEYIFPDSLNFGRKKNVENTNVEM
jgi:hypothetical protein